MKRLFDVFVIDVVMIQEVKNIFFETEIYLQYFFDRYRSQKIIFFITRTRFRRFLGTIFFRPMGRFCAIIPWDDMPWDDLFSSHGTFFIKNCKKLRG